MTINRTPINRAFNVAVLHIANRYLPCGYDVSDDAPTTLAEATAHYRHTGRVLVWNGASERTAFADREVNFAFRAWHDAVHIAHGLKFEFMDEIRVARLQGRDIGALYGRRTEITKRFVRQLAAETIGQLCYKERHGEFPEDQWAFVKAHMGQELDGEQLF